MQFCYLKDEVLGDETTAPQNRVALCVMSFIHRRLLNSNILFALKILLLTKVVTALAPRHCQITDHSKSGEVKLSLAIDTDHY